MAFALVRSTISPTVGASITPTFGGTPTAGNLLLCSAGNQTNSTAPTCSDSNGNWTLLASMTGQSRWLGLFGLIAVASQPTVVTVAQGASSMVGNIYEFSGLIQGGITMANIVAILKGGPASANGASGTATTGASITGAQGPDDLIFHQAMVTGGAVTVPTFSDGTFTAGQQGPTLIRLMDHYKLSSTPDTVYNGTGGWTTARNWLELQTELRIIRKGFF